MNEPDNPIKELRETLNLSQRELSERLSCSVSTILRTEQGLYNDIPPLLMDWYTEHSDFTATPITDYRRYQTRQRLRNGVSLVPYTEGREGGYFIWEIEYFFIWWRKSNGYKERLHFCRAFCYHPSTIIRFEKGVAKNPPKEVLDLFRDWDLGLKQLTDDYALWRRRLVLNVNAA